MEWLLRVLKRYLFEFGAISWMIHAVLLCPKNSLGVSAYLGQVQVWFYIGHKKARQDGLTGRLYGTGGRT